MIRTISGFSSSEVLCGELGDDAADAVKLCLQARSLCIGLGLPATVYLLQRLSCGLLRAGTPALQQNQTNAVLATSLRGSDSWLLHLS